MRMPVLMIAAMSLGTAALAQPPGGSGQPTPPDGATPSGVPMPTQAAPSDPAMPSAPATPAAPDAAASMPMPARGGASAASADTSSYPMCSKTVTDKCMSRGSGAHAASHRAMRKH